MPVFRNNAEMLASVRGHIKPYDLAEAKENAKRYFTLTSVIDTPVGMNVWSNKDGNNRLVYLRLVPNTKYKIPTGDSELLKALTEHETKVNYSENAEKALKSEKIPFEIEACKSCGGRVKKIKYRTVEVHK